MRAGSGGRVLVIEMRRGLGWIVGLTAAVYTGLQLATPVQSWAGHLDALSETIRSGMFVLAPLVAAASVWQAQRERRRGVTDQLDASSRPGWQRHAMVWASVVLPAAAGVLTVWLGGAFLVLRIGGFAGGGWAGTLLVGLFAIGAYAALGVLIGRLVSFRGAAPLAAIALFFCTGLATNFSTEDDAGWMWLVPVLDGNDFASDRVATATQVVQAVWFASLTVGALVLAAAPRRAAAWGPAALAVVPAIFLVGGPPGGGWMNDSAATALTCSPDEPRVCVSRYDAVVLDDVAGTARPLLAKVDGLPGVPDRVEPFPTDREAWERRSLDRVYIEPNLPMTHRGHLADPGDVRDGIAMGLTEYDCGRGDVAMADDDPYFAAASTVVTWILTGIDEAPDFLRADRSALATLMALSPGAQRGWVGEVIRALKACDDTAVRKLLGR